MAEPRRVRELARADVEAELTKLLRHGFGLLTINIHTYHISCIEVTTKHTRISASEDTAPGT